MKEFIDQAAHVAAGALFLLPAALVPNPYTFALASFFVGLVREITEEGPKATPEAVRAVIASPRSRLDIAFWTVGGFIAGLGTI